MEGTSKIGMDTSIAPVPARSPLAQIYSRRPYEEHSRKIIPEDEARPERSAEEGKGLYIDIYV